MKSLRRLLPLMALSMGGCDLALGIFLASEAQKDDPAGPPPTVVTVAAIDPNAAEAGLDPGQFQITRTGSTAAALTVSFTIGGSAMAGSDYQTITPLTATIPIGMTSATVDVVPMDDFEVELDETVALTIQTGAGYAVGLPASASVTIVSDDLPPTVNIQATDPNAAERPANNGLFTVTRSNTFGNLTVLYTVDTSGGNAATPVSDYQMLSGTVMIFDTFSSATIDVFPVNDTAQEPPEDVVVNLTADSAYVLGAQTTATVTITSEDDPFYHVFVATLANDMEAQMEHAKTVANNGDPDPAVWTEVGIGQTTMEFDTGGVPSANAVLLNVIDTQHFDIDAVVLLDGSDDDAGIGEADNTIYWDRILNAGNISGPPDGQVGTTQGTLANKAFFLTLFNSTFTRFRIEAWGTGSGPGTFNVEALTMPSPPLAGNQVGAGAAVNSTGQTYFIFDTGSPRDIELVQIAPDGTFDTMSSILENNVTSLVGTGSIAIDPADDLVTIASTRPGGGVRVRQFTADLMTVNWTTNIGTTVGDHIHPQGGALDGAGDFIVGGAIDWGGAIGLSYLVRKLRKSDGVELWLTPPQPPLGQVGRAWHGVAARGTTNVHTAGDFTGASSTDGYVRQSASSNGSTVWSMPLVGAGGLEDRGNAVAVDGSGNVYVGGFVGTATTGRDIAIWKFDSSGTPLAPFPFLRNGSGDADDEVLDLVVENDGTLYAVGYTSITGQGQDWWVAKFSPAGALVASRTYHGDTGDDRATSAMVFNNSLIVVGHETIAGPETELLYIRYVK